MENELPASVAHESVELPPGAMVVGLALNELMHPPKLSNFKLNCSWWSSTQLLPTCSSSASVIVQQPVPGLVQGTDAPALFPLIVCPAARVPSGWIAEAKAVDWENAPDDMYSTSRNGAGLAPVFCTESALRTA
jgi:hypothetical protein